MRDAVATYISPRYLEATLVELEAAKAVDVVNTPSAVAVVQERLGLTESERDSVFELFAAGGDRTVLGLGQAVTAAAQLAEDGDRQSDLEAQFWTIVGSPRQFVGV